MLTETFVLCTDVSSVPKPELDRQPCAPFAPPTAKALRALPDAPGIPSTFPTVTSGHRDKQVLRTWGGEEPRTQGSKSSHSFL